MGIIMKFLQNMDSDDDVYLCECLHQEERKISDGDTILFARPDGLPMAFENLDFDYTIKHMIEEHGGIVVDSVNETFKEHTIKICSHDSTALHVTEDAFDKLFIHDSLKEHNIVNLNDYRLTKSGRFDKFDYDPIDILFGYKGWNEIKPSEEEEGQVKESQPDLNIEFRERDDTFEYCELGEAGSLKTEDQLWEGREPHQVYISQEPEEDPLGDFEMMKEGTENPHTSKTSDVPEFVKSLMQGKLF